MSTTVAYTPDPSGPFEINPPMSSGSGGSGSGEVFSGNYAGGTPTDTPVGTAAVAFDTSNGTQWDFYSNAWH